MNLQVEFVKIFTILNWNFFQILLSNIIETLGSILVQYQFYLLFSAAGAGSANVSHLPLLHRVYDLTLWLHIFTISSHRSCLPARSARSAQIGWYGGGQLVDSQHSLLSVTTSKNVIRLIWCILQFYQTRFTKGPSKHWLSLLQFLPRRPNVGQGQPSGPSLGHYTNILQRFDAQGTAEKYTGSPHHYMELLIRLCNHFNRNHQPPQYQSLCYTS